MKHKWIHVAMIFLLGIAATGFAANPVTVTFTATPAAPGATATAKAVVTINDGSTLQGLKWTQTGGVVSALTNDTTDTVSIALPAGSAFKQALIEAIDEQPIADSKLPPNIPSPKAYESSVQNRFGVIGIVPHALSVTSGVGLDLAVTTSSGTYHATTTVSATLPWQASPGVRTVPINIPVLLHGKAADNQTAWDWVLTPPTGSAAKLNDATTQWPDFTPDVSGDYTLTVTDQVAKKSVNFLVHAGTWRGIIVGQDNAGLPTVDAQCMQCHVQNTPNFDLFTPWKKTGHAAIFSDNVKDNSPTAHYAASCLGCHTVGYNTNKVNNGGISDQSDFAGLLNSGLISHGDPSNWSKILTTYPASAKLTNIQCENCHGPQGPDPSGPGHMNGFFKDQNARISLASNVCGSCHGEPARHGRYQQWQLSMHSNYETAIGEGTNASCAKCHSAQGFIQWQANGFSTQAIAVNWTAEDVQPATCQTCHDPHDVGTTSGQTTNAPVRMMNNTPKLDAGFTATNVGSAAICMSCHNSRRGLHNDQTTNTNLAQAPHVPTQADILMGQNLYFVKTGTPGFHGQLADSCVNCHMEKSLAPTGLYSASSPGTNHTFFASTSICNQCHTEITADDVQGPVETKLASLSTAIGTALNAAVQTALRQGNSIDLAGQGTLNYVSDFSAVTLTESHGSSAIAVTLKNGTQVTAALGSVNVIRPGGAKAAILSTVDPNLPKAMWNLLMIENDKSKGVHNPAFVNSALDISLFAANAINANTSGPNAPNAAIGGGLGNGAGAVSCTTPYVYWTDIAGHAPGSNNSQWRTDLIARNLSGTGANLKFFLHQANAADLTGTGVVGAAGQNAFEDIVATTLGGTSNIGSLEICSDQPLLVMSRIFNAATGGTFGQNLDGNVANNGYNAGETVNLIGLRQQDGAFRTNLTVTNGGTTDAQVTINLFDATGKALTNYTLTVPAGKVLQDNEPLKNRAGQPNVGWGFATVTVLKGTNVLTSAAMIDAQTNDPTTIPPKQ